MTLVLNQAPIEGMAGIPRLDNTLFTGEYRFRFNALAKEFRDFYSMTPWRAVPLFTKAFGRALYYRPGGGQALYTLGIGDAVLYARVSSNSVDWRTRSAEDFESLLVVFRETIDRLKAAASTDPDPGNTFKTCATLARYMQERTGIPFKVFKTTRYLNFTYPLANGQRTERIVLPCGALYELVQEDLEGLIQKLNSEATKRFLKMPEEGLHVRVAELEDLVRHCWVHSGCRDCGADQMTTEQRALYREVVSGGQKDADAGV